jgi:hypothetical protein
VQGKKLNFHRSNKPSINNFQTSSGEPFDLVNAMAVFNSCSFQETDGVSSDPAKVLSSDGKTTTCLKRNKKKLLKSTEQEEALATSIKAKQTEYFPHYSAQKRQSADLSLVRDLFLCEPEACNEHVRKLTYIFLGNRPTLYSQLQELMGAVDMSLTSTTFLDYI